MGSGQFGTGQFGPGQFGTRTIRSRIIRYQDNSILGQFGPGQFDPEMTITQKIKIRKISNLIFFLFSRFRIFHVNLNSLEKKNLDIFFVQILKHF